MELNILAALADKKRLKNLKPLVPQSMINPNTAVMLAWYDAYFGAFPEATCVEVDPFISFIKLRSKKADPDQLAITLHLAEQLRKPVAEDVIKGIVSTLHELDLSGRAGALLTQYDEGDDLELSYELLMMAMKARASITDGAKPKWESGSILDSLLGDSDEGGLQWDCFDILQSVLKGLQPGDNVGLAAPTDQGKTSLLCWLVVHFQRQAARLAHSATESVASIYRGRPVLMLINEGTAARVRNRLYGTAVQQERDVLIEWARSGKLEDEFAKQMGGADMVRCVNVHGKNMAEISRIIEEHGPHLVVSDMTGRIKATSNKSGGANDIGQLEEVWDEFRQLAAIHKFAHIGTVQVSAEGFNMLYPPISALQNSKTGIQTTWDLALIMGALTNPDARAYRGLSTPKNKLAKSGQQGFQQFQVWFDPGKNEWSTGS
ncbi:DNA helicase [Pseudomonas phage Bertil]|uniref:DNA helicase n=1 Tax=Pseudomonas phage Bertil TaxID=2801385 RepID=A0A7T8IWG9_9CAUD|nr:DNA helicase [Pseudomonas phage Bertil]QQO90885.1 DNA primase [Pseudomonas phage Strit]